MARRTRGSTRAGRRRSVVGVGTARDAGSDRPRAGCLQIRFRRTSPPGRACRTSMLPRYGAEPLKYPVRRVPARGSSTNPLAVRGPVPVSPSAAFPPVTRPTHRDRSDIQTPCLAESARLLDRPFYWICVLSLLRGESRRPGRPFLRGRRPVPRTRRLEARVRVLAACARACRAHHPAAPVPPPPRDRRR